MRKRIAAAVAAVMLGSAIWAPVATAYRPTGGAAGAQEIGATRDQAIEAYVEELVPALETSPGWTGSTATCTVGTESPASRDATVAAVNYYRGQVGLPDVGLDADLSAKALRSSLMMQAEGALSHSPGPDWACYHADGDEAAGSSNLSLGNSGARAVASQVRDFGANNAAIGHRRWILYPSLTEVGTGSTDSANTLWVINEWGDRPQGPEWVTWPPAGDVPWAVVPVEMDFVDGRSAPRTLFRWSISSNEHPSASYADATVTAHLGEEALNVTVTPPVSGYGDNTLVFAAERSSGALFPDDGAEIEITVSGIVDGGEELEHTYTVRPFRLTVPGPVTTFAARPRDGAVTVSWIPPADDGGDELTGFVARSGNGGPTCSAPADSRSCTITGLTNGQVANITVSARNRVGTSPTGAHASVTPEVQPDEPTSFPDVGTGHPFHGDITWMAEHGLATGYASEGGAFKPADAVSRQAMAAFLFRYVVGRGTPAFCGGTPLSDVDAGHQFCSQIAWLVDAGIATGFSDGTFRGATAVSRQAMAAFLYRLHHGADAPACTEAPDLPDVSVDHPFCGAISWLASTGISTGYAAEGGVFKPAEPVSRQAMAAFLHRFDALGG